MQISNMTKEVSGILLITVPTIEIGGAFLLHMLRSSQPGYMDNPLRQNMFRAGHAHAGVLVILSLVCQLFVDALETPDTPYFYLRLGVPIAAILMPLGFFLSVTSPRVQKPNGWILLVYIGALFLAINTLWLGVVLFTTAG